MTQQWRRVPSLLRNIKVKEQIQRLKQNRLNREFLEEADIFQKYMDIAFADMTEFIQFGRKEVPVTGPDGLPIEVTDEETGERKQLTREINVVRFCDSDEVDGTLISEVKAGEGRGQHQTG